MKAGKIIWILNFAGLALIAACYLFLQWREKADGIPKSLRTLMKKNPEATEFVMNYPKYQSALVDRDISEDVSEEGIPLFLQWDERWGYEYYGDDFLAVNGCGPTCLSMVYSGLTGESLWNPLDVAKMAEEEGYYLEGVGSLWALMEMGAEELGLTVEKIVFDEAHIREALSEGCPIICSMYPGDFTTEGHFIVLAGLDEEGEIIVRDPNSRLRSDKSWELQELIPQIRNLWGYSIQDLLNG